jgi:ribosomal protein S18 acetylase RimI-like enzyme
MKQVNFESLIEECSSYKDLDVIVKSLGAFNLSKAPQTVQKYWIKFNYKVSNNSDEIIGGIMSMLSPWGGVHVNSLWVSKNQRKKGIGARLLKKVEQEGISKGATICFLETFDFQAKGFYEKMGYKVFGTFKDYPKGHNLNYLFKNLVE